MASRIFRILIVLFSSLLFSCADPIPVPHDKLEYVGLWVASDRFISIFANGRFEYKEKLGFGMHNRTESNFIFEGDKIKSVMFSSYTIDQPPYNEQGQWKMKMNGILYTRTGPPRTYGRSNNWPKGIH